MLGGFGFPVLLNLSAGLDIAVVGVFPWDRRDLRQVAEYGVPLHDQERPLARDDGLGDQVILRLQGPHGPLQDLERLVAVPVLKTGAVPVAVLDDEGELVIADRDDPVGADVDGVEGSEEKTSELQSLMRNSYAVL